MGTTWWPISEVTYKNSLIGSLRGPVRSNRFAEMNRTSHHYFCNEKFRMSKSRALAKQKARGKAITHVYYKPRTDYLSPYENAILDREMISSWNKINKPVWEKNTAFDLPLPRSCDCASCSACKTSPSVISHIFSASVFAPLANIRILLWWKTRLMNIK